ncbi:AAA family ATPase [Sneathiella sp.]|uniref:AAA family ATPase n=1 Tax=Sneathiella sp. TaxID=1964365 RepID=UPI0026329F09|nr:AAA family ATPase [Sneathiella sp.]MDF2365635.1 AAA family ATPase [Sneathiella sp.]
MIEKIHLASEGSYDAAGTTLDGLKVLNFIFGANGSGKTTISRVIENAAAYPDCNVTWTAASPLETRVYNRDFVEKHFDADSNIKGIYTFGENVEVAAKIKVLKSEASELSGKIAGLKTALHGEDGTSGKQKEQEDLNAQLVEDIWNAKRNLDDLDDAFTGLNNNKKKFCARYKTEAENNSAELRDIGVLRNDAVTVFSDTLSEAAALPTPDTTELQESETATILGKKIIGKTDVDIAALIEKLGNSDWVQLGRQYFEKLDDQCPFCQQKTDVAFRKSLEEYFDESYIEDISTIDKLLGAYESCAQKSVAAYNALATNESPFLDSENFKKDFATLRLALEANIEIIKGKKKEPSAPVTLKDTKPLIATLNTHVETANAKVKANNDTIHNIEAAKKNLSSQVWKRLIEDTKAIFGKFKTESGSLGKAITGLSERIAKFQEEFDAKQVELEENESKITSIKPTIDAINKLLKSFGFTNFHLVESGGGGFYAVERPDGSDAKGTLSEGEKSFITFLYFYHFIRGSFSSSGATTDRIVVFDDPVSSLDADILFIVCNLIKGIIAEMREGSGSIKQVFVLTHNIYFHKEITFNRKRSGADALHDETFWIIRKSTERSELAASAENPIKSSYELLWREVRQKPPSDTAIQNVMRRILEHYFKFFGGITLEKVIERFEGQDKLICGSLLSWVNDGSHFANDDLFMSCNPGQVDRYLTVFQRIFEESEHGGHYKMMMGDAYVAIASTVNEAAQEIAVPVPQMAEHESVEQTDGVAAAK